MNADTYYEQRMNLELEAMDDMDLFPSANDLLGNMIEEDAS